MDYEPDTDEVHHWTTRAWRYARQAWPSVKKVRGPFFGLLAVCCIATAAVVFFGARFFYGDEIADLERDVRHRDGTIQQHLATIETLKARGTSGEQTDRCRAHIETLGEGHSPADGALKAVTRLLRVVPADGVYGVTFYARGDGINDLRIKARDPARTLLLADRKIDDGLALFVQNPAGLYEVTVVAKNPDLINFEHSFSCEQ